MISCTFSVQILVSVICVFKACGCTQASSASCLFIRCYRPSISAKCSIDRRQGCAKLSLPQTLPRPGNNTRGLMYVTSILYVQYEQQFYFVTNTFYMRLNIPHMQQTRLYAIVFANGYFQYYYRRHRVCDRLRKD